MTDRADWIQCVGFGDAIVPGGKTTWCGGPYDPYFVDPTHAALNGRSGGRLVACPECVKAICDALCAGHDELVEDEFSLGVPIRCRFEPRLLAAGKALPEQLRQYVGQEFELVPMWKMEEGDRYPGEWAMARPDGRDIFPGTAWIASGDVVKV